MPTYNFKHRKSGKVIELDLPLSEREEFLDNNPEYEQIIKAGPRLVYEPGTRLRVDDGFRESVARIKENYKINAIKDH